MKHSTRSITKQILNSDTGELENARFIEDAYFKRSFKQGWRMIYVDYDDMLEKTIRSSKDIAIFNHLKNKINKEFELNINITKEAMKIGIGRNKLSVFLSRMVESGFLKRTDIGFISNPFMYIPYRANSILDRQDEWKELEDDS